MIIGDALAAACRDPDVLARLGGTLGESARAKAVELRAVKDSKRERAMAAAIARAPIPAGLRAIHPTWIEAVLAALPPRARDDFASGGMKGKHVDATGVWLARWASSSLAPLVTDRALVRPRSILEATRLTAERLTDWLADVGADQMALALGGAATNATGVVGERLVRAMKRVNEKPRLDALGTRRAAIERCTIETSESALVLIGARTIAPHTDAIVRRQLALRLPRAFGLEVAHELRTWIYLPNTAPGWDALCAP